VASKEASLLLQPTFVRCGSHSIFLFDASMQDGPVILRGLPLRDVHARATNTLANFGPHVSEHFEVVARTEAVNFVACLERCQRNLAEERSLVFPYQH
jgi:hypothetical protein